MQFSEYVVASIFLGIDAKCLPQNIKIKLQSIAGVHRTLLQRPILGAIPKRHIATTSEVKGRIYGPTGT